MENNAFKIYADAFRKTADKDPVSKKMVIMYEALDQIEQAGALDDVLNTGVFNDNIKAYAKIAMDKSGLDDETKKNVLECFYSVFDEYTAKEAMKYYKRKPA